MMHGQNHIKFLSVRFHTMKYAGRLPVDEQGTARRRREMQGTLV